MEAAELPDQQLDEGDEVVEAYLNRHDSEVLVAVARDVMEYEGGEVSLEL